MAPTLYAVWLALTNSSGQLVGIGNFTQVLGDYRFLPAFENVAVYLVIWLVVLVVAVVGLALMLHGRLRRVGAVSRFVFYLPGALAGAASALVWMFMLDPSVSPLAWLLHGLGYSSFTDVIAPQRLPVVFALMAFWTGAGGWIVVMYGALNNIPDELLEAARIDGASALQTAWRVQIPMLRKWIAYMVILAFATGTQLFVEPQLVGGGQPRRGQRQLVAEPARVPVRLPLQQLQRRLRRLDLPAHPRPGGRRAGRVPVRPVRGGAVTAPALARRPGPDPGAPRRDGDGPG